MNTVMLRNTMTMPQIGYGVFQIEDAALCEQSVSDAMQVGYRLFDTAAAYFNEEAVGEAIKKCGIPRAELFITSKLWIQDYGYDNALRAFDASLQRLNLDYLDLYLLHQPFGDTYSAWRALERLYEEKTIRAIGVCNFSPARLVDLCLNSRIAPMVNQIELHPFFHQPQALSVMKEYSVQAEAWGPLCEGQKGIFTNKVLTRIGKKYQKTAAQVALRWNIQRNVVVIPKTVHRERMQENFDIWDFTLSEAEMKAIQELDMKQSEIINHDSACTAKWLNQWKIHDEMES